MTTFDPSCWPSWRVAVSAYPLLSEGRTPARYLTRFIGTGGKVLAESAGTHPAFDLRGDEGCVRAAITDSNGRRAWTQPVFTDGRRNRCAVARELVRRSGAVGVRLRERASPQRAAWQRAHWIEGGYRAEGARRFAARSDSSAMNRAGLGLRCHCRTRVRWKVLRSHWPHC